MSLINDALKRARETPPQNPRRPLPPGPPPEDPDSANVWLVPAIAIVVLFAVIFFIGWAVAHHSVNNVVEETTAAIVVTQVVTEVAPPIIVTSPPPPVVVEDVPKLQGIFYSPTAPTAIVDGKTVSPGDHYQKYRVAEITRYTVTLVGPDGKSIKLGMSN